MKIKLFFFPLILFLFTACSTGGPQRTYTDPEAALPDPVSTTDIPYIVDGDERHLLDRIRRFLTDGLPYSVFFFRC